MGCGRSTGKVTQAVIQPNIKQHQRPVSTITSPAHRDGSGAVKGESSGGSRLTFQPARLSDLATMYRSPGQEPTLRLDYVYGYGTRGAGNNLYYLSSSDLIVYPAASVCVLHSASSNTQRFLGGGEVHKAKGHTGPLAAVTVSPARDLIATGEAGDLPLICLWELPGTSPILTIEVTGDSKGTKMLAFSPNTKLIASIDLNQSETVRIYEVKSGLELLCASGKPGSINTLAWNSKDEELWTAGEAHFAIWKRRNEGQFAREDQSGQDAVTVLRFRQDGTALLGGKTGKLTHISASTDQIAVYPLHPASVSITALHLSLEETLVGSSDSKVIVLNSTFQQLRSIETPGIPLGLDQSAGGILCGTSEGAIVEFGRNGRVVLMDIHAEGEVAALAFDKAQKDWVLSTGGDNKLKCWDITQKRCLVTGLMEMGQRPSHARGLDISASGHVAIGYDDGHFTVRMNSFQLNNIVAVGRGNRAPISVLKYAPNGTVLALGTEAGTVLLYSAKGSYPQIRELKGHKGRIAALDWSKDGTFLRSQDVLLAEKRWKVESGEVVSADKEQDWGSDSRLLVAASEFGPSAGAKSPTSDLVAQGSPSGLLELYTLNSKSTPIAFKGHSYLIRSLAWSADGQTLVTAGGPDLSILQWKLA